ncbi:MAG TPA: M48 family metalloprotease [Roseiarcus sp.]|nr:M48 family metalloprotease [Roseiarcus sp.]
MILGLSERARGGARRLAAAAVLLAPFLILGCANLDNSKSVASLVPSAAPRTTGGAAAAAAAERRKLVDLFGGEYSAPVAERYLNGVLTRLAAASPSPSAPYRVTILNSPIVNAFALPSGDIFVTRGLLALANDTSEIAAVMAHEIAHITARHAAKRAELVKTAALFSRVSTDVLRRPQEGQEEEAKAKLSLAHFSREQEFEADKIGIKDTAAAGYDPYAASRFLASLGRSTALRAALLGEATSAKPDIMSTHPSTPERVEAALQEARAIGPPGTGDSGRDAYLSAIDGVVFGDDSTQGLVRGTRFIHPKLGFAFNAPDGFVLDNQSAALIGVGDSGAQALRLDSIMVDPATGLDTAIASGWIDGVKTSSVQKTTVNDLPAATAIAQGDQWSFRLGAVRIGDKVYRLIFAAHALTPSVDERFRASLSSFHRLNLQEASTIHPAHIEIVTAQAGDTADSIAARMAVSDRPLEHFLLLNGLEKGGPLQSGQRYKIVVE